MNISNRTVCMLVVLALLTSISTPNVVALIEEKSLKDIVKDSDSIITGKVTDKRSYYTEEGNIFTDVTISIYMNIKGNSGDQIVIKVPGGVVEDTYVEVSDTPFFEKEEDVLIFSKGNEVVGWNQGKYTIKDDKIKETGESLAEFVHKIKKEGKLKSEKGKKGKDIDIASATLDTKSIIPTPISNSNNSKNSTIESPSTDDAIITIKYEGFEGAYPNDWVLYGDPTWGDTSYTSYTGDWSGWNADEGVNRVEPGTAYPSNMNGGMVYGPFSLADATSASVTFRHLTNSESGYDYFQYLASTDGSNFGGYQLSGDWTPWKDVNFDISSLSGQPNVWIAFRFISDSTVEYNGTFLDDITIQKDIATTVAPHITSVTPAAGPAKANQLGSSTAASDSTQVTILGTNFGTTAGSVKFWRLGTTIYDATIVSWTDTQIMAKVPGRISGYTKPDGSGNVQVVKSDGTPSDNYGNFRVTWSYGGGKWSGTGLTYKVNPNTADDPNELAAIQAAINTWNTAGANFGLTYGGLSTKTSASGDGENSILWRPGVGSGILAIAWTRSGTDLNVILENDIEFNDDYMWGSDGSASKVDIQTIGTHELGHWLQLLDMYGSQDSPKIMYGYGSTGSIRRVLNTDDISGIVSIYGVATNNPPNIPTQLAQYKADGVTGILLGGTTTENSIVAKGGVSDLNSDTVQLEVEEKPIGTAFTNIPNCISGSAVSSGITASATCSGLANGQYHWQTRAKDEHGAVGSWLSAGDNPESSPDFVVDMTTPIQYGTISGTVRIS